jgi:hypothetical protein
MGEIRNAQNISVGRTQGKTPLIGHSWKENIEMDLRDTECERANWKELV